LLNTSFNGCWCYNYWFFALKNQCIISAIIIIIYCWHRFSCYLFVQCYIKYRDKLVVSSLNNYNTKFVLLLNFVTSFGYRMNFYSRKTYFFVISCFLVILFLVQIITIDERSIILETICLITLSLYIAILEPPKQVFWKFYLQQKTFCTIWQQNKMLLQMKFQFLIRWILNFLKDNKNIEKQAFTGAGMMVF